MTPNVAQGGPLGTGGGGGSAAGAAGPRRGTMLNGSVWSHLTWTKVGERTRAVKTLITDGSGFGEQVSPANAE